MRRPLISRLMHGAKSLSVWIMAAMLVVLWTASAWAQLPTATPVSASDAEEMVELPVGPPVVTRDAGDPLAVIPDGQEELLAVMMGRGATLAGGCTLSSGQVNGPAMVATYACPGGPVAVELVHPDKGAWGSTKTERFAIALKSGNAPDGMLADLVQRVRTHEATFEWKWLGRPRSPSSLPPVFVLAAVGVAIVALLGVLLRARRSR